MNLLGKQTHMRSRLVRRRVGLGYKTLHENPLFSTIRH